jgi:hypothetical protein
MSQRILGERESAVSSTVRLYADGSVPELKVVNRLAQPVLLLDGEELLGTKKTGAEHDHPAQGNLGNCGAGQLHRAGPLGVFVPCVLFLGRDHGPQSPDALASSIRLQRVDGSCGWHLSAINNADNPQPLANFR